MGEGHPIFHRRKFMSRPGGLKKGLWFFLCLVVLVYGLIALERSVIPTLVAIAETEVARVANEAIVNAVNARIADLLAGKTLLDFKTTPAGEILYVQVNNADLNRIQSEALDVLQRAVEGLAGFEVRVPLGQVLGSRIFAPAGPSIPVTLYPYGTVKVDLYDSYEVTGINQTKFQVDLKVTCMVRVVIPLISARTEVSSQVPLVTALIPGKVPPTYLSIAK